VHFKVEFNCGVIYRSLRFLSRNLVFGIFPSGHPNVNMIIDFPKVEEIDKYFGEFVVK